MVHFINLFTKMKSDFKEGNKPEVYVVGATNAGKSTFLNSLCGMTRKQKDDFGTYYVPKLT